MPGLIRTGDVAIDGEGLDADRLAVILDRRMRDAATPPAAPAAHRIVLAFAIGGERFGLPLDHVAAVLPATAPTPVPGAPPAMAGLIVSRGVIHNLFDPAAALGVVAGEGRHMLLLREGPPRLALRIDEGMGMAAIPPAGEAAIDRNGLTEAWPTADGGHIGLIALPGLIEALGVRRRGD